MIKSSFTHSKRRKGFAMVTAVLFITVFVTLAMSLLALAQLNIRQSAIFYEQEKYYYAAESAAQVAAQKLIGILNDKTKYVDGDGNPNELQTLDIHDPAARSKVAVLVNGMFAAAKAEIEAAYYNGLKTSIEIMEDDITIVPSTDPRYIDASNDTVFAYTLLVNVNATSGGRTVSTELPGVFIEEEYHSSGGGGDIPTGLFDEGGAYYAEYNKSGEHINEIIDNTVRASDSNFSANPLPNIGKRIYGDDEEHNASVYDYFANPIDGVLTKFFEEGINANPNTAIPDWANLEGVPESDIARIENVNAEKLGSPEANRKYIVLNGTSEIGNIFNFANYASRLNKVEYLIIPNSTNFKAFNMPNLKGIYVNGNVSVDNVDVNFTNPCEIYIDGDLSGASWGSNSGQEIMNCQFNAGSITLTINDNLKTNSIFISRSTTIISASNNYTIGSNNTFPQFYSKDELEIEVTGNNEVITLNGLYMTLSDENILGEPSSSTNLKLNGLIVGKCDYSDGGGFPADAKPPNKSNLMPSPITGEPGVDQEFNATLTNSPLTVRETTGGVK